MRDQAIPFPNSVSYTLAGALAIQQAFSPLEAPDDDVALHTCQVIDERFDQFWESLRSRSPHLLRGVRNEEVLDWHFHFRLSNDGAWILTVGNDPILAYAIFLRYDNPRDSFL